MLIAISLDLARLEKDADGPTLSVAECATVIGLDRWTVLRMCESGDIRSFRPGRNYKVLWRSLRAYLFATGVLPLTVNERRQ